ncbi:MAG TPA: methylated-DNA--[protein]-cysteine S-methyltransferase [Bacteroidales bacterium]|nr:methylated-DNA--[protein]-cysteine S-methyltransferase [Bacteroidales bacterium]
MISAAKIKTVAGRMTACSVEEGICLLEFSEKEIADEDFTFIKKYFGSEIEEKEDSHLKNLRKQLNEYFSGERQEFTLPLVTPGTSFQQLVWKELQKIKFGTTRSYMQQAESMGMRESIRAIAGANGKNRIAILIPCHRVIGTDGSLTGYAGGIEKKKWLLDHESKFSGKAYNLTVF